MRLTDTIRQAVTHAVMSDLPTDRDFDGEAAELIRVAALKKIPKELHEWMKSRPDFFHVGYARLPGCLNNASVISSSQTNLTELWVKDEKLRARLDELATEKRKHLETTQELRTKVIRSLAAFSTVKRAKEALPEFAKYFPADEAKASRSLPAIRGTVDALKEAGWPAKRKPRK